MKKFITLLLFLFSLNVFASSSAHLESADIDVSDKASLKRGAKTFVTYCLGCHSAKHIRYKRIAMDFGLNDAEVLKDIAPEGAAIYDQMHSAMNGHDANKWFGTEPPDLSLIARSRGADWLFSYLKGFYVDKSKPMGVNNTVFEDVGMPNMLWQLQGLQAPVYEDTKEGEPKVIEKLEIVEEGTQTPEQFDQTVNDLVNFLQYIGEPVQVERERMGKYVLFFFFMFIVLAYLLKKEYWKDVH